MSANNNNPMKSIGVPTAFGNSGGIPQSMPMNHQTHLLSQTQPQSLGGSHFPGHFQLSEPQAQALAQAQYAQVHAQAQAQAAHAHFQAQLKAQPQPFSQLQNSGSNNVGVSSPSISTPGTGSAKRAPQKPPSRPPGSSGANIGSPLKTMELAPAARRKKQKLPEKQIPDKVAAVLPESALYTQLLEFESRVDSALARKKIDIQESIKNPPRVQKTLRIYVFNTSANQTQVSPEKKNAESPSWSLKIIGRILEDGVDPDAAGLVQKPNSFYPKFSYFFKKITIYLDQSLYPDNHVILWESARSPALNEGFEHKIKLFGNSPSGNTCYDVLVDVPVSLGREMSAFLANLEKHKEIDACDEAISVAIKKIHEHRRRRAFFLGFSQSPAEFINALIASQSKDLKLVAGDASHNAEGERRSDFYNQPWVEDAVISYLNRKSTAGRCPGST
ncbi:hypothetical protein LOK49_LG04G02269 [Camellia lanceoleosa]|uniref:Uncharacterized protein n=1 Tax=Camellia lanceoleosa TaxID=1840588 RepID=A0ACC0HYJ3_9ERIC|nr:hypothetical protein LOK49_LG04G02269 [Camellia lanceoleosa]